MKANLGMNPNLNPISAPPTPAASTVTLLCQTEAPSGRGLYAVKRVLRHRTTKQYFRSDGWTDNPEEATSYTDVVEAALACVASGLVEVELAVRVESADCDIFCTPLR